MQQRQSQSLDPTPGSPESLPEAGLPPGGASPESVFAAYRVVDSSSFDETLGHDGNPRPAWARFRQWIDGIGAAELTRRWDHSQRLIYENGIATSAYGDPDASKRPWQLDAVPLLIEEQEWDTLASGIVQRAQLLALVLADLHGPQRVFKERVLPPQVVYGHPGFLPCYGQAPAGGSFLHHYACDLGRAADGKWWVLADRAEAPSGLGFALENRVVLSRMLPEIFRSCNVRRLAPFFINLKSAMTLAAKRHRENPRIVLLSRGAEHESYLEDAYLARYLGYTLVQGNDLAIRDNAAWLKTLDGLLPVDVVLRRPNSEACDPLEFSGDQTLGAAGLLHAARSGNVAISNPLGSGLAESPVFMAFMPKLCKFFLGEPLAMPGIATWWCGEPKALAYVLENLDKLCVTAAYRRRGLQPTRTEPWSRLPLPELKQRILARPNQFVAQERLTASTAPVWRDGRSSAANLVLRAFAVTSDQSFAVLPGGLARTSEISETPAGAIPDGRGGKDTWIISSQPVENVSLLSTRDDIAVRRSGSDLPSRVADNLFWLGRQIERADAAARLLRTVAVRMTSETAGGGSQELPQLLRALAEQGQIEPDYAVAGIKDALPDIEETLPHLIFDTRQAGSLRCVLDHLVRVASLVRDRLSVDSWRIITRIDQEFKYQSQNLSERLSQPGNSVAEANSGIGSKPPSVAAGPDLTDVLNRANTLIVDLAALQGMITEGMTRSHVFRFLDMGRRLERAMQTIGLARSCFIGTSQFTGALFEAVLEIADCLMTYRSRYLANLQLAAVLDLLLTDETNPRSVAFQLAMLQQEIAGLPRDEHQPGYPPQLRLIMSMLHDVRMVDIRQLAESHALDDQDQLALLLNRFDRELPMLSEEIARRYLVHAGPTRKLTSAPIEI